MQTVYVGLSGGVDSAVSAFLLKQKGYRVVGAFIKGWEPDFLPCTGTEDRLSAMRVAAHLGIPFKVYDLEEEYKRDVVDYFVSEYREGRTPNPDVMCNRAIKFGAFWKKAKADGADMVATGHYAVNDAGRLKTSKDTEKDQTYFLWMLTREDLRHTLFPVGDLEKKEVRRLAEKAALPNAARKDSQGLCFLGHVDMTEFLKRYIPPQKGIVLDESGNRVGEHEGVWYYTLGQHLNLGGLRESRYVVSKDVGRNELVVSENPLGEHPKKESRLSHMNWISEKPEGALKARFRYRQPLIEATVSDNGIAFEEAQLIAPGQSVVFYDEGECLGGGIAA
jgi:tRNA-specific 2-thiouridylase